MFYPSHNTESIGSLSSCKHRKVHQPSGLNRLVLLFAKTLVIASSTGNLTSACNSTWKTGFSATWTANKSKGVTPEVDFKMDFREHTLPLALKLWLWNPEETSPKIQNRGTCSLRIGNRARACVRQSIWKKSMFYAPESEVTRDHLWVVAGSVSESQLRGSGLVGGPCAYSRLHHLRDTQKKQGFNWTKNI